MVAVLGFDVGGANTKTALVETLDGRVEKLNTALKYFPLWKKQREELSATLLFLKNSVAARVSLSCVALTMTAELSDVFRTKREGVLSILDCVSHVFPDVPILVVTTDVGLSSVDKAKADPLTVAGANWAATGWMVSQHLSDCIVIDVGSTSTSIIPIVNGKVVAAGRTDLQKLSNGELVYTGSLRTNVAAIVQSVPLRGGFVRVSSELFAQSADVHLILKNITEAEYTSETADGRGKTAKEAKERLARIICADTEILKDQEIQQIASYVYQKQIEQIASGLSQVCIRLGGNKFPVVVTGLGKDFLARYASEKVGIVRIFDLGEIVKGGATLASPAAGAALMAAAKLEGDNFKWMQ